MLYVQSTSSSPIPVVLFMFKSMFFSCVPVLFVFLTGAIELSVLYYLLVCLAFF